MLDKKLIELIDSHANAGRPIQFMFPVKTLKQYYEDKKEVPTENVINEATEFEAQKVEKGDKELSKESLIKVKQKKVKK